MMKMRQKIIITETKPEKDQGKNMKYVLNFWTLTRTVHSSGGHYFLKRREGTLMLLLDYFLT